MAVPPIAGPGPVTAAEREFDLYQKYGSNPPPPLGPLLRLHPKPARSLPSHPHLPSTSSSSPSIAAYLAEAHTFITAFVPRAFERKGPRNGVEVLAHKVPNAEVPFESRPGGNTGDAENWSGRESLLANGCREGAVGWGEVVRGLFGGEVEGGDVKDRGVLVEWEEGVGVKGWEEVRAGVCEVVCGMPALVDDRVFPVFEVRARREGEVVVLRVPVEAEGLPGAKHVGKDGVTVGQLVSVEQAVLVEDGAKVQLRKAVSVDAGGKLPSWARVVGSSGELVKEVGAFVEWAAKGRGVKELE